MSTGRPPHSYIASSDEDDNTDGGNLTTIPHHSNAAASYHRHAITSDHPHASGSSRAAVSPRTTRPLIIRQGPLWQPTQADVMGVAATNTPKSPPFASTTRSFLGTSSATINPPDVVVVGVETAAERAMKTPSKQPKVEDGKPHLARSIKPKTAGRKATSSSKWILKPEYPWFQNPKTSDVILIDHLMGMDSKPWEKDIGASWMEVASKLEAVHPSMYKPTKSTCKKTRYQYRFETLMAETVEFERSAPKRTGDDGEPSTPHLHKLLTLHQHYSSFKNTKKQATVREKKMKAAAADFRAAMLGKRSKTSLTSNKPNAADDDSKPSNTKKAKQLDLWEDTKKTADIVQRLLESRNKQLETSWMANAKRGKYDECLSRQLDDLSRQQRLASQQQVEREQREFDERRRIFNLQQLEWEQNRRRHERQMEEARRQERAQTEQQAALTHGLHSMLHAMTKFFEDRDSGSDTK